jgi:WD40 repeat protein
MLWAAGLAACGDGGSRVPPSPTSTPAPLVLPWQPAQAAIGVDNPIVKVSGVLRLHQRTVNDLALSSNGSYMATTAADEVVAVWDLSQGESLFFRENLPARHVFFGPGDETLITVDRAGLAQVWALEDTPPARMSLLVEFMGATAGPVVQAPDRTLLAFGMENGDVRLWRVPQATEVAHFQAHRAAVGFLTFSPDGQYLASIGAEHGVRVWEVPSGELLEAVVDADRVEVEAVPIRAAFSPDSSLLAVASALDIRLWALPSGELVATIAAARQQVAHQLRFSPDGRWLVGCGAQPSIGVWEVATRRQIALLPLPGQGCRTAAFAPDGSLLVTLPTPGRDIFLWNLAHLRDAPLEGGRVLQRADRRGMDLPDGVAFFDIVWPGDGRFIFVVDETGPIYVLTARAVSAP